LPEERQSHQSRLRAQLLDRARSALGALEAARQRIDDLNVYPVPDGDTGTNMTQSVRAIVEAISRSEADDRATLAQEISRAALMGARGNSGVLLSQIVRGAAESFAESDDVARALRGASDAAYRAVRTPVEGTMLTAIRELAEEAEAGGDMEAILARGDDCVARTRDMLPVLREAGVVDSGAAGLIELFRGLVGGAPPPETPSAPIVDALHHEPSQYRYCTSFVIEAEQLDAEAVERELDELGDSLLVVGGDTALRVHVHTDDPDRALALGAARGSVVAVEIVDMHEQIAARDERLSRAACAVVVLATGDGNRRLLESLGATALADASDLSAAITGANADEVILLPNDAIPTIQAALSALVAFDPAKSLADNLAAMYAVAAGVRTGAVLEHDKGWAGLVEGEAVAETDSLEEAALAVIDRLLDGSRGVLTLLTGEDPPSLVALLAELAAQHPGLEVDMHEGGQPGVALLLAAE
jgi:DAK2 domain fusion protein YloV